MTLIGKVSLIKLFRTTIKTNILRFKLLFAFLAFLLLIATPVSANEIIKLNLANKYLNQARDLKAIEKPQEAQEALQLAKDKLHTTLFVKTLKNEEVKQTEKEIEEMKRLEDERIKGVGATNTLPSIETTTNPSNDSQNALNQNSYSISTPQSTATPMPPISAKISDEELNENSGKAEGINSNDLDKPAESPDNPPNEPAISIEQQKATKVISISDSIGNTFETNCQWSTTHYECPPKEQKEPTVSIKTTPQLTFTINAQDPDNRPLTYHYYYAEGCRGEGTNWIANNSCTFTLKTNELGLRTFSFYVKNDDNYGSVGLDADTSLYYRVTE